MLIKPGIIRGNAMTAAAGFFFASKGTIDFWLFLAMLSGISLTMASACVFNNYIDRDIDKKMVRTKKRALVTGEVSARAAIIYATLLGISAVLILGLYTNLLTLAVAAFGFFAYVVLYGIGKRKTVHGTVIGSISGAVPPVIGYIAVSNHLNTVAIMLFLILVFWQMPHFYAIAMYRLKDYTNAKIPVLPIIKGNDNTKIQILLYIDAFMITTALLTLSGYAGYTFLVTMTCLSITWLWIGIKGFKQDNDHAWARSMFGFSLLVLTILSVMLAFDSFLP